MGSQTMEITGYNFADKTDYTLTDRPSGCSYHHYGNVEEWSGLKDDCDVNGYGGCFCDEAHGSPDEEWTFMGSSTYGFVKNKKCEDYGMLSNGVLIRQRIVMTGAMGDVSVWSTLQSHHRR